MEERTSGLLFATAKLAKVPLTALFVVNHAMSSAGGTASTTRTDGTFGVFSARNTQVFSGLFVCEWPRVGPAPLLHRLLTMSDEAEGPLQTSHTVAPRH